MMPTLIGPPVPATALPDELAPPAAAVLPDVAAGDPAGLEAAALAEPPPDEAAAPVALDGGAETTALPPQAAMIMPAVTASVKTRMFIVFIVLQRSRGIS